MAPLVIEVNPPPGGLAEKHSIYNNFLKEALQTNQPLVASEDDDIQNLLNIDVASKRRNLEYILETLKSEDQLLVSKAIKRSTWLFTDPQYAHIINPEYLYTEMYPIMTSKAFNKLMLNIRLHLKDEKRVEGFYNYIKERDQKSAFKWLQRCSVPFVEIEVAKYNQDIPEHLILRLYEKSISIFEAYHKQYKWIIEKSDFLIRENPNRFLDIYEKTNDRYYFQFSVKATKHLMEKCPQRILANIENYIKNLNIKTFTKYLNKTENVYDFLLKHVKNEKMQSLYKYNILQHFIWQIPKESRFVFVKKFIIDKEHLKEENVDVRRGASNDTGKCAYSTMYYQSECFTSQTTDIYQWYKFAPFDVAFTDLKKLIRAESSPEQRNLILQIMLICARRNLENIHTVLQFYRDKHINEPFKFKIQFVNYFISKVNTHYLDEKTWNLLNELFHSMEVYIESDNNVQFCIKAIIVRNAIKGESIPDIIKNKFEFDTLKRVQKKLKTKAEKDSVFNTLWDLNFAKYNAFNLTIESEFNEAVTLCTQLLLLLNDWNKDIQDYLDVLFRVRNLVAAKKEKRWSIDLSSLYNIKKAWRKTFYEESITICPSIKVCINALKHDPTLLSRNIEEVEAICFKDTVLIRQFLRKIRIYWSDTIAEDWKASYLKRLDQSSGHKSLIIGLCTLLPPKEISNLLQKYAPSETKIDWNETNSHVLSLRKQVVKNVHKARPPPSLDEILLYAKGDYLQYAVPSLNSILNHLSPNKSRLYILKLLDAPVSLQKFGVHWAFNKLTPEELKSLFSKIWTSTKSLTIRTILFTHTVKLLCKEKNESNIKETWDLLCTFIDKLTPDDNKCIFKKLGEMSDVPSIIKPQFFMKSYTFLSSLPAKCNCESILKGMQSISTELMESLDNQFVVDVLLKKFIETFATERYTYQYARIVTSFILASSDAQTQIQRYDISFSTILEKYLPLWDTIHEERYSVKKNIQEILENFVNNIDYTIENKMHIPLKIFENILLKLEGHLSYQKEYVLLTLWKLTITFIKLLDQTKHLTYLETAKTTITDEEKEIMFRGIHEQIAPLFAKACVQHLKEDLIKFGSSVYMLYSKSITKFFHSYLPRSMCNLENQIEYIISFLRYENEKEVWLMIYNVIEVDIHSIYSDSDKKKYEELRQITLLQPNNEIKMHYNELFSELVPYVPKESE